jgi:hypothetical protein
MIILKSEVVLRLRHGAREREEWRVVQGHAVLLDVTP